MDQPGGVLSIDPSILLSKLAVSDHEKVLAIVVELDVVVVVEQVLVVFVVVVVVVVVVVSAAAPVVAVAFVVAVVALSFAVVPVLASALAAVLCHSLSALSTTPVSSVAGPTRFYLAHNIDLDSCCLVQTGTTTVE